jgi:protein-S-isoprenylcysteine O-methyltransferase Ste14
VSKRRLPDLGPRGEGWFVSQVVLGALVLVSGALGPAWTGPARLATSAIGLVLIGAGAILGIRGVLDLRENLTVFPRPVAGARLVETGAYTHVRHPIYGGTILAAVGWALATASLPGLLAAAVLALFFGLKSRREEAWLVDEIAGYAAYRRRTRRFIPGLY